MLRKPFEIAFHLNENIFMRKISVILAILFLFASNPTNPVFCAESEDTVSVSTEEEMLSLIHISEPTRP